ncbi:Bax inhibitor-1 family protein [Solibacillus sp. CAU 1738]|uniref:Bax inhibitor-1/YccA family protein n=1 Tax=Solibacillus sp. CAU 1738 TaxID=3140363 RepID=UPI00326136EC
MKNKNLSKVLKHFMFMWILTAVGLFVGTMLPPAITMPISIITLILLIIVIFVRNVRLANSIMYVIPFLLGITLFWTTQFYINELGSALVFSVFIGTIIIFIVLAFVGMMMKDISGIGSYLFAALIVAIVFSVIFMFIPVGNTIALVLAGVMILLFTIYTVYDFNLIRHNYVGDDEVVGMALNLYLDFINLFTNILEVIWRLKDE